MKRTAPIKLKRKVSEFPALEAEIRTMRRDPAEFTVVGITRCKWCPAKSATQHLLSHPKSENAGAWCSQHGWIMFDSVKIRPAGEEYVPRKRKQAA